MYSGKDVINYNPSENQWWITGFNPEYKDIAADELTATYTVDFSSKKGMYNAFIKLDDYLRNKSKRSISEDNKYKLTFTFK
jgi:hypothetical protein